MKCLVTGGGGFLGRHIVDKLLGRGYEVSIFGRKDQPDLAECGVRILKGDIANSEDVLAACEGIETVFHVAAKTGISGRFKDYYAVNVTGTRNIISSAKACGVKRLIYTSTPSVVFGKDKIENGDESLPYPEKYLTAYAATKAAAEREVLQANCVGGLMTCALRPHLVWGPGDTNLAPRIAEKSKAGKLLKVGDGTNLVSVIYVENAADAHVCASDKLEKNSSVCGKAYFINEPEPVNCWDFIGEIIKAAGAPPVKNSISAKKAYRIGAVLEMIGRFVPSWEPPMTRFLALQLSESHYFRIDEARAELGWEPKVSIEEGLKRMAASFCE